MSVTRYPTMMETLHMFLTAMEYGNDPGVLDLTLSKDMYDGLLANIHWEGNVAGTNARYPELHIGKTIIRRAG